MIGWDYLCAACGRLHAADHVDYCVECGAPVLAEARAAAAGPLATAGPGVWRYCRHLPLSPDGAWLSLGEGGTSLVSAPALAEQTGVHGVWLMLEGLNPTGSFKDRAAAVGLAHAVGAGAKGVVCASSGNAAAAAAAYAARAGLPAVIVVPESVPPVKLRLAQAFGAVGLKVPGDYSAAFSVAWELCRRLGFANLATTYVNPNAVAALRTVAFEIACHLGDTVSRVVVPTGAGPLVHGVASGFGYLAARGDIASMPQVDAVQMAGCAPITHAYENGHPHVHPWDQVTTAVSGLNDPLQGYPGDGTVSLTAVRSTGGVATAVTDEAAAQTQQTLATRLGLVAEPAAATAVAALTDLSRRGVLSADDTVVCAHRARHQDAAHRGKRRIGCCRRGRSD